MGETELRRTLRQVLNYSALSNSPHHLSVAGLGVFHINEAPERQGVDVVLDALNGSHMRIDFENLEFRVAELIH